MLKISSLKEAPKKQADLDQSIDAFAKQIVEHIFDQNYREDLRRQGKASFEKVITENAMFLQQDLRLTTAQITDYMKSQITSSLKQDIEKYSQSIKDAEQVAIESIRKTNEAIEQQRLALSAEVDKEVAAVKQQFVARFENNMADIVNHYIMAVIGDNIDLDDQLEFIIAGLEAQKKDIVEDIKNGG